MRDSAGQCLNCHEYGDCDCGQPIIPEQPTFDTLLRKCSPMQQSILLSKLLATADKERWEITQDIARLEKSHQSEIRAGNRTGAESTPALNAMKDWEAAIEQLSNHILQLRRDTCA